MSFTQITPFTEQLPNSDDPPSFDARTTALMSWLVSNLGPEITDLAAEIAIALNGEEDTLAAVQAITDGLGTAAARNVSAAVGDNANIPDGAAVKAYVDTMGGSQSGGAPLYAARAWVNFNGTGVVAIRASGNVSSITDGGNGDYTVNFTVDMPDANYVMVSGQTLGSDRTKGIVSYHGGYDAVTSGKTVSSCRIRTGSSTVLNVADFKEVNVAFLR